MSPNAVRPTPITDPNEIVRYLASAVGDSLYVPIPDGLIDVFERINRLFDAHEGPFKLLSKEPEPKRQDITDLYARAYSDVRLAISATWYNLRTFEQLCTGLEELLEAASKRAGISTSLEMNMSFGTNKLMFEYEHFMFHQKCTVDRLAHFFLVYFGQSGDNIFSLETKLSQLARRTDLPKHRFAETLLPVIEAHKPFLDGIHGVIQGRGRTERDRIAHMHFINFGSPVVWLRPGKGLSVEVQARTDRTTVHAEDARVLLCKRYQQVEMFTWDMLESFFIE